MALRDTLDELSTRTEAAVDGLFDRRRAGQVDEERFTKASAAAIDRANAAAVASTNREVAAAKAAQQGKPVRPTGDRPFPDRERLHGAVKATATKDDGEPEDPETRRQRLRRIARSEPYSTAQDAMPKAMSAQGAKGWIRVPNAKACKLCRKWADGKVRPPSMAMLRHPGCTCLQRPVFREVDRKAKDELGISGRDLGRKLALQLADPTEEIALSLLAGGGAYAYRHRQGPFPEGPTIFERFRQLERNLAPAGIDLVKGEYMVHGSGLLDALNIRQAADLDLLAHPDLYERISEVPGWRRVQAGVNKDVEILTNSDLHMQVAKAVEESPPWRRQITIADLETNTVTLQGREFIKPDLLAEMKKEAIREGAKVPKNIRDIQLLDGRLIWKEDVARFGDLLNRSRLSPAEERAVSAVRHPSQAFGRGRAELRAQAKMRAQAAKRRLKAIATVKERRALQKYGRGSFDLNEAIRHGAELTADQAEQVRLIDQALAKQFTPFRVKTYRGLRMTRREALAMYADKVGTIVSDPSYTSTGLRESVARKYGQSGVYMEFDVPAGTNGYYAPYRALTSQNLPDKFVQVFGEDELLLPRNLRYEITSIEERADGTILIRAKVVPTAMPEPPLPGMGIQSIIPPGFPSAAAPPPSLAHLVLSDLYERGHTFDEVSRRFLDGEMGDNWLAWRNLAEEGITPSFRLRDTTSGEEFLIKGGAQGAEAAVTEAISYRILAAAGWNVPEARVLYNSPPGTPGRRTMAGIQRIAETQYGPDWEQVPRGVIQQSLGRMIGGGTDNGRDILDWIRTSGDPDAPMRTTIFDYLTAHEDRHFGNVIVIKHPDPRLPDGFDYRLLPIDNAFLGETIDHDVPFEAWVLSATRNIKWIDASRQTLDLGVTTRPFGGASEALRRIIDQVKAVDVDAILEEMLREGGYTADTFYRGERLKESIATRLANLERDFDVVAERFYRGRP